MHVSSVTQKYFSLDEILQDVPDIDAEELNNAEEAYQSYKEELNQELMATDRVWIEFQAGQCEQYGKAAKSILYRIVKSSVDHPENCIAAANAITILKEMGVSFSCVDLNGVKCPQADLSESILDRADLSYADLTKVNLKSASLNQTQMKKAILKNVSLGLEDFLTFEHQSLHSCYSYETNTLFIAPSRKLGPKECKGYILNLTNKTIKEVSIQCKIMEMDLEVCKDLFLTHLSFICEDRIATLAYGTIYEDGFGIQVYAINASSEGYLMKIINTSIDIASDTFLVLFKDYLLTIDSNGMYSSIICFYKYNRIEDRYEMSYSKIQPYKNLEYFSSNKIYSSTNPFLPIKAVNIFGQYVCIIFNYKIGEVAGSVALDEPFSQAAFSDDMQYLALVQYNKLFVYTLSSNDTSTLISAKSSIEPIVINISDKFDQIQFYKNKYLIFVNKNNELTQVALK